MRQRSGKMSMTEASFRILAEKRVPMHYREITDLALKRKMILTSGKTPEQTLLGSIRRDERFLATKTPGVYTLSPLGRGRARRLRKD